MIQEVNNVDYLMISATIRIGRESWCLPYGGFLIRHLEKEKNLGLSKLYICKADNNPGLILNFCSLMFTQT